MAYYLIKITSSARIIKGHKKNLQIVESISVGFQCYIQLIRVSDKYIVIGISKDKITYLTEVSKDEIKIEDEINNTQKNVFSDYLTKYSSEIIEKIKKN